MLSLVPRLRLTRRDAGWAEGVARHAVVGPAVSAEPPAGGAPAEFVEALLAASPLTTVLHRPPDADRATAGGVLSRSSAAPGASRSWSPRAPRRRPIRSCWSGAGRCSTGCARSGWRTCSTSTLPRGCGTARPGTHTSRRPAAASPGCRAPRTVATLRFWLPLAILDEQEQRESGLAYRVERGGAVLAAPGTSIKGRILLDHAEYGPVLELVNRHRASLQNGGA
nr:hypothetical protein GCM10020092_089780 [Actinoplanes digitatis]